MRFAVFLWPLLISTMCAPAAVAQDGTPRSRVWRGLEPPKPFFLGREPELWEPNVQLDQLDSLELGELPDTLVQAYLSGAAKVYPRILMWKANSTELRPFAIFGSVETVPGQFVVAPEAHSVIAVGGRQVALYKAEGMDAVPTMNGTRERALGNDETSYFIGRYPSKAGVDRRLVLKRLSTQACDRKQEAPRLAAAPLCSLHKVKAVIVEARRERHAYSYREVDAGEAFIRARALYRYEALFVEEAWWEKFLAPLIQSGRNK